MSEEQTLRPIIRIAEIVLQNLPPETPTASLNPVRLEAELEPYGSGWGIKSTRVATWAEEDAEPEPDSKAWTTLFEDCKE